MNLNELSQKLEDHLTDQDIQDAQELLDDTYQEVVDIRGELAEAQAEIDALKQQNAELISAFSEVLRISDRQHDAWEAAKKAIAKAAPDGVPPVP